MKIFFNTSVSGRKEYEANYIAIDKALKRTGHDVVSGVFVATKREVQRETETEATAYYTKLKKWIREADILVFEVSYPSLGVGHEITWGMHLGKPTIVLYVKGKRPFILDALPNEKLQVFEYEVSELDQLILDAVGYAAGQQDTRFNFFITPKQQNYLDWVSKNRKVPRAVYLRRLIEEDMKNNEEYEG